MRRLYFLKLFLLLFLSLTVVYIFIYSVNYRKNNINMSTNLKLQKKSTKSLDSENIDRIVISFVVCETRYNESLNVIKSVLLFTRTPVYFVIFTDDILRLQFNETLTKWKALVNNQLDFELQKIKFPKAHEEDWLNLFSKCAAQRLFIPMETMQVTMQVVSNQLLGKLVSPKAASSLTIRCDYSQALVYIFNKTAYIPGYRHSISAREKLISHIDAMIYVDTDTLFLGPPDELWRTFAKFNSSQMSAMTLEDDNPNVSWYPRFAKHPFYGRFGLNSGVMLMNLTRMRDFGWVDYVTPIMLKWKLYIPWGDQDIINIIFHYHPRAVRVLSCRYNYRSDQCMYGDACADASRRGVLALHGSRGAFHGHKQPAFQAIYKAIDEYELGTDPITVLIKMDRYLTDAPQSLCGSLKHAFLKVPLEVLTKNYTRPFR